MKNDIFRSIFPPDVHVSEQQARAWANSICSTGTSLLRSTRNLFLWKNFTSSLMVKKTTTTTTIEKFRFSFSVFFGSFRFVLHRFVNQRIDIRFNWSRSSLYCTKNLSSLSGHLIFRLFSVENSFNFFCFRFSFD